MKLLYTHRRERAGGQLGPMTLKEIHTVRFEWNGKSQMWVGR